MKKCLVIRFSSFGDIVQSMGILPDLRKNGFEVHWITKKEFADIATLSPLVHKVWSFDKTKGIPGLIRICLLLRKEGYTHVYDAHRSVRSLICSLILRLPIFSGPHYVYRPKERWKRLLLFTFGINRFPDPFRGSISFMEPLKEWTAESVGPRQRWDFDRLIPRERRQLLGAFQDTIVLAPSAAWKMKRWPLRHWIELVERYPQGKFIILGGPQDDFCRPIAEGREHVTDLIGRLSLVESCYLVSQAKFVISADTGIIHVADLLGVKGICLMGPTAFGFPTGEHIEVLGAPLPCRPCSKDGRGRCTQKIYQQCMVDIAPDRVIQSISMMQ